MSHESLHDNTAGDLKVVLLQIISHRDNHPYCITPIVPIVQCGLILFLIETIIHDACLMSLGAVGQKNFVLTLTKTASGK